MSNDEPQDEPQLADLPSGCVPLPEHLNGIADAAFKMIESGESPDDMLSMLRHGLNKSRPHRD